MSVFILAHCPAPKYAILRSLLTMVKSAPDDTQTTSRTLSLADLSSNLQQFFGELDSSPCPVIILIYDEKPLRSDVQNQSLVDAALKKLGISTFKWKKVPGDRGEGGLFRYVGPAQYFR